MPVVDTSITFQDNDQVTASKLNSIMDNSSFVSGAVVSGSGLQITAGGQMQIGDGSNGITTAKIADLNVTTAKIADLAITTGKIADSAITTAKIPDGAITTAKIADSTSTTTGVTTSKIANASITPEKLNGGQSGNAPIYGCRAWVNFNGVGGATIRQSGNVSSVTRTGTGKYTITFTTAMPDASYCLHISGRRATGTNLTAGATAGGTFSSTQVQVEFLAAGVATDVDQGCVSIFR